MMYINEMEHTHPLDLPGVRKQISDALGISTQAVTNWKAKGEAPIEHCAAIEKATKGTVTRKHLRPRDWQSIWPELAGAGTSKYRGDSKKVNMQLPTA